MNDLPHIITTVETTPATVSDDAVTQQNYDALKQRDLLPDAHLVDTGYVDAELILESERQYSIDLFGPVRGDYHRQAKEGKGFAAADFAIDWEAQQATCPEGHTSINWTPVVDRSANAVIKIKFSMRDCQNCERHMEYTDGQRRSITVRPHEQYKARPAQRTRKKPLNSGIHTRNVPALRAFGGAAFDTHATLDLTKRDCNIFSLLQH